MEETSLGELLPGSILSDSLKPKIFTGQRSPGLSWDGEGMKALLKSTQVTEYRNTVRTDSGHNPSIYRLSRVSGSSMMVKDDRVNERLVPACFPTTL